MKALPIFLNISQRECLVAGGGEVAWRKARLLARAQARLRVVAPKVGEPMQALLREHGGRLLRREVEMADLEDVQLAIAATDDPIANENVSQWAKERNIPVNVVDQPALCTFYMPAIVDRSPVVVAISSSGTSPVLTRGVKELNEVMLPDGIDRLARLLGSMRDEVKKRIERFSDRTAFWECVLDSEVPELVYAGREAEAKTAIGRILDGSRQAAGEVWLVGAGPGDPDLLTLRALRLLYRADIVLYDRLVSKEVLARARPDAELIHVGKGADLHSVDQYTINDMLVRYARQGRKVMRLKGGDPFIFGRGGEELASMAEAGINFQIVPGITAATGCAAYAGIPLTHRDHAHSVQFVAGHLKEDNLALDWAALIRPLQTLVFYMGLKSLPIVCGQLQSHGMSRQTPAAVVSQGTTRRQQVVAGELHNLPERAAKQGIQAPAIIIIGEVVALRESFAWYQNEATDQGAES